MPRRRVSEMDEAQRRAMFARLHAGGGGRHGPASGSASARQTGAYESDSSGYPPVPPEPPRPSDVRTRENRRAYAQWVQWTDDLKSGKYGPEAATLGHEKLPVVSAVLVPANLGAVYSRLGALGRALASWKTPIASSLASWGLGEVREDNPTLDPRADKALALGEQIAGYVAAISGLASGKAAAASGLKRIPAGHGRSVLDALKSGLRSAGDYLTAQENKLAAKLPAGARRALGRAHRAYTTVAEWTGSSLADVLGAGRIPDKLRKAARLQADAADDLAQADAIAAAARDLATKAKDEAGRILKQSHKGSLVDWQSAERMYGEGAAKWYAAEYGELASKKAARLLRDRARLLGTAATNLRKDALTSGAKAALVLGGFAAKEAWEESDIQRHYDAMMRAFAAGENYSVPAEQPRGPLTTAAAFALGTLGNPVEKQTRYGRQAAAAQTAYYRAQYDLIGRTEQSGQITPSEARALRTKLAERKPWNMAGKGAWTFAPAAAAYLNWQTSELSDWLSTPREVVRIESDPTLDAVRERDADTFKVADEDRRVRYLGIDAPEIAHAAQPGSQDEYLGRAAADRVRALAPDGSYVRLVGGGPGVGFPPDAHGRDLAYVEKIPDLVARIPLLRDVWPGTDLQLDLLQRGLAQPRYDFLGDAHSRRPEYHAAARDAIARAVGVHSPQGQDELSYHWRDRDKPAAPQSSLGPLLGQGLMVTGQSGALRALGPAGNAVAQTWNALLAAIGTADYNQRARARPDSLVLRPPSWPHLRAAP